MTSAPSFELLFWRRKRPISGTVATPAIPLMVRASDEFIMPATMAHSPSFSVTVDLICRLATTGIPFTAVPASSLNSASTSSVTSSIPWMCGVAFSENPRSSKVKEGGGT